MNGTNGPKWYRTLLKGYTIRLLTYRERDGGSCYEHCELIYDHGSVHWTTKILQLNNNRSALSTNCMKAGGFLVKTGGRRV